MQVARGKPCNHQIIFKLFHPDELSGVRKQTTKHNVNIWKGSICAITSNGPAVGLSKRYPTQHPGRVLVPRASGARKLSRCKEGMAHFLPSGYRVFWTLRVSRYKFDRSPEFFTGYKFGCGHWRSVAVQAWSKPENCQGVDDFNYKQMRVSGCRNHYKIVLGAGAKAKSVTSLLTLPSVLCSVIFVF